MKSKLLILTPGFTPSEEDDTCVPAMLVYLNALLEHMDARQIYIIAMNYPYQPVEYHWQDIKVHGLGLKQNSFLQRRISSLKAYQQVVRIAREFQPQLIHSFWLNQMAPLGNQLSKAIGAPHLCTMMGQDVLLSQKTAFMRLKNTALVAVSEFQKEQCALPVEAVIHWGMETIVDLPEKAERSVDILGVGWLNEVKNYAKFIRIVEAAIKVKPNLNVLIMGTGTEEERLKVQISEAGLQTHISMTGLTTRKEVLSQMKKSKVLLHTSDFESFGMVLLEAVGCGMNTLSHAVGIAGKMDGSHVAENEQEMIDQLISLLDQPAPSKPHGFPIENTVDNYLKLYQRLICSNQKK